MRIRTQGGAMCKPDAGINSGAHSLTHIYAKIEHSYGARVYIGSLVRGDDGARNFVATEFR